MGADSQFYASDTTDIPKIKQSAPTPAVLIESIHMPASAGLSPVDFGDSPHARLIKAATHPGHPDNTGLPAATHAHATTRDHLSEFYIAMRRRKAGVTLAAQHVKDLVNEPNEVFVEKIGEDCHIGPHWEWIPTASIMAGKAAAKGYVLAKASEGAGLLAKVAGGAFGLGWGAAAGLYTGYHLTEYKENSCIADNLEKRLMQFQPGGKDTQGPIDTTTLPVPQLPEEIPLPGVRDVWNSTQLGASKLWFGAQGKPIPDRELQTAEKVAALDSLDSKSFTAWAREESASNTAGTLAKEGIYAGTGYLLSGQVLSKLHIAGGGNPAVKIGAAIIGAGLAWASSREAEHERFVELEAARTISKPEDFTDNASFVSWAKGEAAADPYYKYGKEASFGGIGFLGATYAVAKLGLGPKAGGLMKFGGVVIGATLGWLGTASHEEKALADLYTARLISMPDDHP